MRKSSSLLALVLVLLAGACSAVDDFTAFHFVDGGATDAMAQGDLSGSSVGDPCATVCSGGLTCFNNNFPGGTCSSACNTNVATCPTGSTCGQVDGTSLCLQACNPAAAMGCRTGWACCDGQRTVLGPGFCAPSNSSFCGH